jgi:hypothetical protein
MLTLRKSQKRNEASLEGLRPRRHLSHPAPCRLCTGEPLGAFLSVIPVAIPDHARTSPRRPLDPPAISYWSQFTKPFGIRTYTKYARNPFRIRTSKTQDLKPFRMSTYGKTPGGGGLIVN